MELAEHVEHLSAQGKARLLEFFQQSAIHVTLPGFERHEIPQVADFCLADTVDAAKALLQAIGIPRQVVVHHQVGALKVDALPRSVRGEQHLDIGVVKERLLSLPPLLSAHSALNGDKGAGLSQQGANAPLQIGERVAVFREDHELLVGGRPRRLDRTGAVGRPLIGDLAGDANGCERLR